MKSTIRYDGFAMESVSVSGQMLADARRRAGLTQATLARLAGTSQSAIAAYETGVRQPTLPVLERMVGATGHHIAMVLRPDPTLLTIARLANEVIAAPRDHRLRLVFDFIRHAAEDGHPLELLVASEPAMTGDSHIDAMLAAVVEDLCTSARLRVPDWVHDPARFLDHAWWVASQPSARAHALVHTPASYRRRGIMIDRRDVGGEEAA